MTLSRRAGCGKSARPVRGGGGRRRSDGEPYTGTKLETADTAKGSLDATAPAPDPTRHGQSPILEEALQCGRLTGRVPERRGDETARIFDACILRGHPREEVVNDRAGDEASFLEALLRRERGPPLFEIE